MDGWMDGFILLLLRCGGSDDNAAAEIMSKVFGLVTLYTGVYDDDGGELSRRRGSKYLSIWTRDRVYCPCFRRCIVRNLSRRPDSALNLL